MRDLNEVYNNTYLFKIRVNLLIDNEAQRYRFLKSATKFKNPFDLM
jgi:hypothetical protein